MENKFWRSKSNHWATSPIAINSEPTTLRLSRGGQVTARTRHHLLCIVREDRTLASSHPRSSTYYWDSLSPAFISFSWISTISQNQLDTVSPTLCLPCSGMHCTTSRSFTKQHILQVQQHTMNHYCTQWLTFLSFTLTMKILPLKVTLLIRGLKYKQAKDVTSKTNLV